MIDSISLILSLPHDDDKPNLQLIFNHISVPYDLRDHAFSFSSCCTFMSIFVFTAYENNTQSLLKTWEVQESFDKKQTKKKHQWAYYFHVSLSVV